MPSRCLALVLICLLFTAAPLAAQSAPAANAKPISQQGLLEALRIGGLTTLELIDIVKERGVAFPVTEQVEADLRAAGALTALIDAVRANYRPPAGAPWAVKLGPLAKNEIITLLQVGTPPLRVEQLVKERGVSFAMTQAISDELTVAGANQELLAVVDAAWPKPAVPAAAPQPAAAAPSPAATPAQPVARLASLKEVHKLYIDKIKNNLDQYLRVEISKQLPERFTLVMNKDEADALLVGTGEKQGGAAVITGKYLGLHDTATGAVSMVDKAGTVLWASEAGDRTLLFGPLKRGGAREVAKRLVQDLKKKLEELE